MIVGGGRTTIESPAAAPVTNTHILTTDFDLVEPRTLDDALAAVSETGSIPMAGGTDLLIQMKLERRHPARVISLSRISELCRIDATEDLVLGATATIDAIAAEPLVQRRYTALAEACGAFSTVAIMAMGTIGGNLCNASPASDAAPALLAFGATVELVSRSGSREVSLVEFFTGPGRTVLAPGELLLAVRVPSRPTTSGSAFIKIARVQADIAKVCVAVSVVREGELTTECRIALGSVAPTPLRVPSAEAATIGKALSSEVIAEAERMVREAIAPITDQRSTAAYRRHVAGVATGDALRSAWMRAGGAMS